MDGSAGRKARGAFFTPPEIAAYLCDWALRGPADTVLEPSCGEAGFLLAAARRLQDLSGGPGGSPSGSPSGSLSGGLSEGLGGGLGAGPAWAERLHGVEIFEASARAAEGALRDAGFDARISVGDFFAHAPERSYDAIVGNPPFVRYQNFTGAARARSLEAAVAQGVRLSGLASSWAAFVVKAAHHLAPGGRLALVLPAELLSVSYAREVRRFLLGRFGRVRLIMFEERVFPGVLEEVVLLLAEGSGGAACLELHQTRDVRTLASVEAADWVSHRPQDDKWTPALVAEEALAAYRALAARRFEPLKDWGRAYLGAVTGGNGFFALSCEEAAARGLGARDVVRIAPPGARHLRGLALTRGDWEALARAGARGLLFRPGRTPSAAARRYIAEGERAGVAEAYKCRVRAPWWRVPLVERPDLILTYMNHDRPRLVSNGAAAHILNSVYGVRLGAGRREAGRELLPVACLNSVTLLGTEIVGRSYGGGLLKMEPREADNLPLPSLALAGERAAALRALRPRVARWLAEGAVAAAVDAVDAVLLADVPAGELRALRLARELLFQRRRARGKSVEG